MRYARWVRLFALVCLAALGCGQDDNFSAPSGYDLYKPPYDFGETKYPRDLSATVDAEMALDAGLDAALDGSSVEMILPEMHPDLLEVDLRLH
jgi:hypothetical protein